MHKEARDAIRALLEILNAKYSSEIRNNPHKEAEFMTSKYSPLDSTIKRDKTVKLKDILQLVQTAIIKMFIEADENGNLEDKVFEFFALINSQ